MKLMQLNENRLYSTSSRISEQTRYNRPTASDVAAIIKNDDDESVDRRDIVLRTKGDGRVQHIDERHASYDPLAYILLFPYGTLGWSSDLMKRNMPVPKKVTIMEFYQHRLFNIIYRQLCNIRVV